MGGKLGTPAERFKTKYKISRRTGCWNWQLYRTPTGYGLFYFPPRNMVHAHIASWELHRGSRKGFYVLHNCDNPRCVNPDHLRLGTQLDNMRDRAERGRDADRRGSKNGRAKLTVEQVRAIRRDKRWPRFVAKDYNTPVSTINKIRQRVTWRHI